jgi:hypothetical protein
VEEKTRAQVLDSLKTAHAELQAAIDQVGGARLTAPGVVGNWSVKDVMAHITFWEQQSTLNGLKGLPRAVDDLPEGMTWGDEAINYLNERAYQMNKNRPLSEIRGDFDESFQEFLQYAQRVSDEQLNDPDRFAWTYGAPLWRFFEADGYNHYREHAEQIREWLKQG